MRNLKKALALLMTVIMLFSVVPVEVGLLAVSAYEDISSNAAESESYRYFKDIMENGISLPEKEEIALPTEIGDLPLLSGSQESAVAYALEVSADEAEEEGSAVAYSEEDVEAASDDTADADTTDGVFIYSVSDDGAVITGLADKSYSGMLTIPATFNGNPVTEISRTAFAGCPNITGLDLSQLEDFPNMEGSSDEPDYNGNVKTIIFPDPLRNYRSDVVKENMAGVSEEEYATICEFILENTGETPTDRDEAVELWVKASAKSTDSSQIEETAAMNCYYALLYIMNLGFYAVEEYLAAEDNVTYKSIDGVLYLNHDSEFLSQVEGIVPTLTAAPVAKKQVNVAEGTEKIGSYSFYASCVEEITFPDTLTHVAPVAFCYAVDVKELVFPEGLREIGENGVTACVALERLVLPASLNNLGEYAIVSNIALNELEIKSLYFDGIVNGSCEENGAAIDDPELKSELVEQYNIYLKGAFRLYPYTEEEYLAAVNRVEEIVQIYCGSSLDYGDFTLICHPDEAVEAFCAEKGITYAPYEGHTLTKLNDGVESTCIAEGSYPVMECDVCGVVSENIPLPAKGHTDADLDGECDACGENEVVTTGTYGDSSTYTLYSIGTLRIEGTGATSLSSNILSSSDDREKVTAVYIDSGITSLPSYAFRYFENLKTVSFGEGSELTAIPYYAFYNCYSLTEITIPDKVTSIGGYAFSYCRGLESISLPESLTTIGYSAFQSCYSLTEITIPDKVTSIGGYAIYCCNALTDVYYGGTNEEQWNSIGGSNAGLSSSVTIHYTYHDGHSLTYYDEVPNTCTEDGTTAGAYCNDCGYKVYGINVISAAHNDEVRDCYCDACGTDLAANIKVGSTLTIKYSDLYNTYIRFTPKYSGKFMLSLPENSHGSIYLYDSAFKQVAYASYERTLEYTFEEGKTYFFNINYYYQNSSYNSETPVALNLTCTLNNCAHNEGSVAVEATQPTCTDKGYTAGEICSKCEHATSGYEEIPALGHTFIENRFICDVCGAYREALYSGTCGDNVAWKLYDDGVLYIYGEGTVADGFGGYSSQIKEVYIEDGVTSIGYEAFWYCTSLKSITIPDSVTSIGDYAFYGCTALESITIPESVISIGEYAFDSCNALTDVYYGGIDENAWNSITINSDNGSLTSATRHYTYHDGHNTVAGKVFPATCLQTGTSWALYCEDCGIGVYGEEEVPIIPHIYGDDPRVCIICSTARTLVASGTCGDSVAWQLYDGGLLYILGEGAMADYSDSDPPFYSYISQIKNVYIADGVTTIGNNAFCDCSSLESVTIPDSVTSIGNWAFDYCRSLTGIAIPESVTIIGEGAFRNCSALTSIDIPDSVTSIGIYTFYGCSSLTGIAIPESVTSIGKNAFYDCTALESVTIPDSVTSIGNYAFYGCKSLTEIAIPDSVTSIREGAFRNCSALTSIDIPNSVTSIVYDAFLGCTSLTDIYYGGINEEQWNSISIGSGNTRLTSATIHYTYHDGHDTVENKTVKEATCAETGATAALYCETCQLTVHGEENIPAFGHAFTLKEKTDADGNSTLTDYSALCGEMHYYMTCERCHASSAADTGETWLDTDHVPVEHGWEEMSRTPATCVAQGSVDYFCVYCFTEKSETLDIDPDNHNFTGEVVAEEYKTAEEQCETYRKYYISCVDCNASSKDTQQEATFDSDEYIDHTLQEDYEVKLEPTCTDEGIMLDLCTRCGTTFEKPIAIIDHNYITVPLTFPQQCVYITNQAHLACTMCGAGKPDGATETPESYKVVLSYNITNEEELENSEVRILYLDSNSEAKYITVEGIDFTVEGEQSVTVTVPGTPFGYMHIAAYRHIFRCMEYTVSFAFEEDGKIYNCYEKTFDLGWYNGTRYITTQTSHLFGETEVITPPSCEEEGEGNNTCTVCGYTQETTIPATGHSYESVITDPTCTEKGYTTHTCSVCTDSYTDSETEALGHELDEGVHVEGDTVGENHTLYKCTREGCDYSYKVPDPSLPIENLTALAGVYKIELSWSKAIEATVTGYEIYRKAEGDSEYALLETVSGRNTLAYVDKSVEEGIEYSYKIRGIKDDVKGEFSDEVSATALVDTTAPRMLTFVPEDYSVLSSVATFKVTAEDDVGVDKFVLYISEDDGEVWTVITEKVGTSFSYDFDTTAFDDGEYKFKVVAIDARGNESDGLVRNYKIDNTGPEKVTGLKAEAVLSSKITLSWDRPDDSDMSSFVLQVKSGEEWETVSKNIEVLGYNISSLSPGTEYTYRVAGVDTYGNIGEYSDELSVTTSADTTAPVITKQSPDVGRFNKSIAYSVTASDDCDIEYIDIMISTDNENWTSLSKYQFVEKNDTATYEFTVNLDSYAEGSIYLRAIATDFSGNVSDTSSQAPCTQYIIDRTAPEAPKDINATSNDGYIAVSWSKGDETDLGVYSVYRAETENGEYKLIVSNLKTLNYYDRSPSVDKEYFYKVAVADTCGNLSEYSDTVSAKVSSDTEKPVINSISPEENRSVGASVKTVSVLASDNRQLSSVVIEYKIDAGGEYSVLKEETNINDYYKVVKVTLPIDSFADGQTIWVRAYCVDSEGLISDYSKEVCYTVDKTAPGLENLTVKADNLSVTLNWNGMGEDDLAGYEIYRSSNSGSYTKIASKSAADADSYTVTDNVNAGSYMYRVDAVDKVGNRNSYYSDAIEIKATNTVTAAISGESYVEVTVEELFSAEKSTSTLPIASYMWDFGDGTTSDKEKVTKAYTEEGEYTVTLTVTDTEGNTSTATKVVTVKERSLLGVFTVKVTDENSSAVANAPVYFDLGESNQQIVYTDRSGIASARLSVGYHVVGVYKSGYLPTSDNYMVHASDNETVNIKIIEQQLVTGEFEVKEMTFDEIVAEGIDINDPDNQHIYEATVTLFYGEEKIPVRYLRNEDEIINYWIEDSDPDPDPDTTPDSNLGGDNREYDFHFKYVPNDNNDEIVLILKLPVKASYLKQFYNAQLYIVNNSREDFRILNCEANINVPEGLTVVKAIDIDSAIPANSVSSASWILRGDKAGTYNLSASFSGVLEKFNVPVSASFTADTPVVVYGPETVKLRVEVNDTIKFGTLYFNVGLVNQRSVGVNYPNIDTQKFVTDITEAVKNGKEITDEDNYECELLGIRVDYADGTTSYFETDSMDDELTNVLKTLPAGASLFYEYVVYDLLDEDEETYFREATIECGEEYYGAIEVVSVDMDIFSDNTNLQIRDKENSLLIYPRDVNPQLSGGLGDEGSPIVYWNLEKVTLTIGGEEYEQSEDGFFLIKKEQITSDIIISRSNYYDYVIPKDVALSMFIDEDEDDKKALNEFFAYMSKDKKDGKPYVSTVFVGQKDSGKKFIDVCNEQLIPTEGEEYNVYISAGNIQGKAQYHISQDFSHDITSETGYFTTTKLTTALASDKSTYVYVESESGGISEVMSVKIKIDKVEGNPILNQLKAGKLNVGGKEGFSITLPSDWLLIGGATIDLADFSLPIGLQYDNGKVKISVGFDLWSQTDTTMETYNSVDRDTNEAYAYKSDTRYESSNLFDKMKTEIAGLVSSTKNSSEEDKMTQLENIYKKYNISADTRMPSTVTKTRANMNVMGYIEAAVVNGGLVVTNMLICVGAEIAISYTAPLAGVGYMGISGGGSMKVELFREREIFDSSAPLELGAKVSTKPWVKAYAGLGAKDLFNAEAFGKVEIPMSITVKRSTELSLAIEGKIGYEANALFWHTGEQVLINGTWGPVYAYFGNDSKNRGVSSAAASYDSSENSVSDTNSTGTELVLMERTESSPWLGESNAASSKTRRTESTVADKVDLKLLQSNIYSSTEAKIITAGDTTMAVWTIDDSARDEYNRLKLVYSLYNPDDNTWSEPKAVYDDGYVDASPSVATDGKNIYVVWQKYCKTYSADNSEDLDSIISASEIWLAKYDIANDEFVEVERITEDSEYDYSPTVTVVDGVPVVFYATDPSNSMLSASGNSLTMYEKGVKKVLKNNLASVQSLTSATVSGKAQCAYAVDTDGNLESTSDICVFYGSDVFSQFNKFYENEPLLNVFFAEWNGETTLFTYDDANIYYEKDGEAVTVLDEGCNISGSVQAVNENGNLSFYWVSVGENGNELYTASEIGGEWSDAVELTDTGSNFSHLALTYANNQVMGFVNETNISYDETDGTKIDSETNLMFIKENDFLDLEILTLEVEDSNLSEGDVAPIIVSVRNNGNIKINSLVFTVTDTLGTSKSYLVEESILPGKSLYWELPYTIPENFASSTLTVTVSNDNVSDINTANNTLSYTSDRSCLMTDDMKLIEAEGIYVLSTYINNQSIIDAKNVKAVVKFCNKENEVVSKIPVGTLSQGETGLVEFAFAEEDIPFDENGICIAYIIVTADNAEESVCSYVIQKQIDYCEEGLHFEVIDEAVEATCTESGLTEGKHCFVCNAVIVAQEVVEPLGHTAVIDAAIYPTCTESGLTEGKHCSVCDEVILAQEIIPMAEHTLVIDAAVASTCTSTGLTEGKHCSDCGEIIVPQQTTPMKEHSYIVTIVDPICTEGGYSSYLCRDCGHTYISDETEMTGHLFDSDGVCEVCGYADGEGSCDHLCHKSGFLGFIWKIVRFFWKLFKMNPVCECGEAHY